MGQFTVVAQPHINGGCAITWFGDPYAVLVWEVVGIDPDTQEETAPYGAILKTWTESDNMGRSVNHYIAPKDSDDAGKTDRIKVTFAG